MSFCSTRSVMWLAAVSYTHLDVYKRQAPAGDGVTNLMKYATGLDPLKPCGSVTKVSVEEGVEGSRHLDVYKRQE